MVFIVPISSAYSFILICNADSAGHVDSEYEHGRRVTTCPYCHTRICAFRKVHDVNVTL